MADSLNDLANKLERFAQERDWQQFHSPKNLASALVVEAAELLEHFQWMTEQESRSLSPAKEAEVRQEMADVLLYLIQIATALKVDLVGAANEKLQMNSAKYPIELARGTSKKYDQLREGDGEQ